MGCGASSSIKEQLTGIKEAAEQAQKENAQARKQLAHTEKLLEEAHKDLEHHKTVTDEIQEQARRLKIGDVVCSRPDRTRTGKVEECDGSSNPYRVRWDETGNLSNWLAAHDVAALSEDEVCQRETKYGPVLAQREAQQRRTMEEEEAKKREREEKRKRIGGVGAVVCSLANRTRTGKVEVYDGSLSPYSVRWDDTDDLSGGLTLEDVDAISDVEKQEREAKSAQREEERRRKEEERKKLEKLDDERKKQEEEERKKRELEEKERAKVALFEAARTGELSEMTRLLARQDALDLIKYRAIVGGIGECWSGVERNVPTDRLLKGGWKLHMAAPYNKATTTQDHDPGKGEWLCIAARKAGTDVLVVAAMAKREDVLRTTSSSTEAIEANGVFWYRWPGNSCGFSKHPTVNINPVDGYDSDSEDELRELKDTDGEYRLSWGLDLNECGGWRAGNIANLHTSGEYEKLVFYSEVEGTALHAAAGCSKSGGEAVSLLLDIGGRELLDAPDGAGRTAREIAAASNHSAVVAEIDRWTQQRAAWEQEMQHKDARNASFIAAGRDGQLSILQTLLAVNADVYAKDSEGSTALHRAAEGGHGDVAALLLHEGGQRLAAMPNGRGQTARELAALQQRELDVTKIGVQGSSVSVVSILDSTMRALDTAALQAHTELQARNRQERAYLSAYVAEQEELRASAAALLEQGKPLREQHTALLEEYQRHLREVSARHTTALEQLESPLHLTNRKLNDALSKMYALRAEGKARLDALRTRVQELLAAYTEAHSPATQPLTPDEYAQLLHSILFSKEKSPGDDATAAAADDAGLKFVSDVKKLVIGEFEHAADGLPAVLGIEEDELNALTMQGLPAMNAEVEAIGDPMLSMWWDYVVNQAASEEPFSSGIRDQGRTGIRLEGFAEMDEAKIAGLKIPELAAIRLYSTPAFPFVNDDLRAVKDAPPGEKRKKHPLAVLIALLVRGIKKLRKVDASADEATQRKILWRGMKNVEVTSEFEQKGGTELGAMSTTTDLDVAFNYCRSSRSLIFKIVTENKLQRGASVQWISAFPNESEVLFSPLTFMQPTGKTQVVEIDGYHITIVEVRVTTA